MGGGVDGIDQEPTKYCPFILMLDRSAIGV
jgi:hypothetical protein